MNVSANLIRFPAPAPVAPEKIEPRPQPGELVAFSPELQNETLTGRAHAHGQLHAAQRIVSRVADQLDATATL